MRLAGTIQFCTCTRPGISSLRPYDSVLLRTRFRLSISYLKRLIYPMNITLFRNSKSERYALVGRLTPAHQYSIQWVEWNAVEQAKKHKIFCKAEAGQTVALSSIFSAGFPCKRSAPQWGSRGPSSRSLHSTLSNVGSASAEKRIAGYVRYPSDDDQAGEQLTLKTL